MTNQINNLSKHIFELKPGYKSIINLGYAECKLNNEGNRIIELYNKEHNKLGEFPIYKYDSPEKLIEDFLKFIL